MRLVTVRIEDRVVLEQPDTRPVAGFVRDELHEATVNLSGTAAQFGRPVVEDVSRQLTAKFAACLQTKLGSADDRPFGGEGHGGTGRKRFRGCRCSCTRS